MKKHTFIAVRACAYEAGAVGWGCCLIRSFIRCAIFFGCIMESIASCTRGIPYVCIASLRLDMRVTPAVFWSVSLRCPLPASGCLEAHTHMCSTLFIQISLYLHFLRHMDTQHCLYVHSYLLPLINGSYNQTKSSSINKPVHLSHFSTQTPG